MKTVSLKSIDRGSKINLMYDPNVRLYTVHLIGADGKTKSHTELNKDQALALLNEHSSPTVDPLHPVVVKAITIGIDPSTILGL